MSLSSLFVSLKSHKTFHRVVKSNTVNLNDNLTNLCLLSFVGIEMKITHRRRGTPCVARPGGSLSDPPPKITPDNFLKRRGDGAR